MQFVGCHTRAARFFLAVMGGGSSKPQVGSPKKGQSGGALCGCGFDDSDDDLEPEEEERYIMPQHRINSIARWVMESEAMKDSRATLSHEDLPDTLPGAIMDDTATDEELGLMEGSSLGIGGTNLTSAYHNDVDSKDESAYDSDASLISMPTIRPPLTSDNLKRWLMYIHTRPQLH